MGWVVGEEEDDEEEQGYLLHSISQPIMVGIECPRCRNLSSMPKHYSEAVWQIIKTVKCHWAKIT
jgi:hypothetical protein